MNRHRPTYAFLIILVIALGLGSRSPLASQLPAFLVSYTGDTLWALMVLLLLGFLFPQSKTSTLAIAATAIAFSVEASQLYQSDWINGIRSTRLGALILGSSFLWSDLACYSVGILIGVMGEKLGSTGNRVTE